MQNGGEASEVVHMMLQGGEVAVRLTGSAIKNVAAFLLALRRNHKKVLSGRARLPKLLKHTRDLQRFEMSKEQFKAFKKKTRQFKVFYTAIGDRNRKSDRVDLIMPVSEVERANIVFEKIGFFPNEKDAPQKEQSQDKKKEPQRTQDSRDTKAKSTTRDSASKTSKTNEKPSVESRLIAFDKQAKSQTQKTKVRSRPKPSKGK